MYSCSMPIAEPRIGMIRAVLWRPANGRRYTRVMPAQPGLYSHLDPGNLAMIQERERALNRVLRRHGYHSLEDVHVFEAGCGGGYNLRMFQQWGCSPGQLAGIDIDEARVEHTRTNTPAMRIHLGSATDIPEPDRSFDISLAFTLFSSVPDETTSASIAREMFRITRPGGLILLYDMRRKSPRNPAVHPVRDEDVRRWFPECRPRRQRLTLAPPVARFVCARLPALYGPLATIPLARTHTLHVMRRPAVSPVAIAAGS
jgi:SAM-dependent methyltransferase